MNGLRISGLALLFLVSSVALGQAAGEVEPNAVSKDVYYRTEGVVSGPPAPQLSRDDYPTLNLPSVFGESRLWIWLLAQQHLYLGGFMLGALFLVLVFELVGLIARGQLASQRCDRLAHQTLELILLVFSLTAVLGGALLFALLAFYPGLMSYLGGLFHVTFVVYGVMIVALSGLVYFYYYTWGTLNRGWLKWVHATMGVLLNVAGITLMMLADAWVAFMMAPAGVNAKGQFLGNQGRLIHSALWNPMNVHRFFSNVVLGAAVMAVYTSYRAITAAAPTDRTEFDWMRHSMFVALIGALFTLPFGGYWLSREIYGYRQQMGITMFGGLLAWVNIMIPMSMSVLFLGINYYVWKRIDREGSKRYGYQLKYILFILVACVLVYITPHTLIVTPVELKAMGGQQHSVVGNFGVESSKQPAINMLMVLTVWSLIIKWKSRFETDGVGLGSTALITIGLFIAGAVNLILLGIYGYYIPANVRVGLSVPMTMTTLSVIVIGGVLTLAGTRHMVKREPSWGAYPARGFFAVLLVAVAVSWLMALGGYLRSSLRLFWHVMEIVRDQSPWAFTHTIGFAGNMITLNVLCFWVLLLPVFWLANRTGRSTS